MFDTSERAGLGAVASPHYGVWFGSPLDGSSPTSSFRVQGGDVSQRRRRTSLSFKECTLHVSAR